MIVTSVRLRNIPEDRVEQFPWTLPLVKQLEQIEFTTPITFFVGENGSGKSTILEAMAAAAEVPLAGSFRFDNDPSLAAAYDLGDYLTYRYAQRISHGFFVRAEDFIGFARQIKSQIKALEDEAAEMKATWTGGDIKLALGAVEGEKNDLIRRYSADLEAMSHGEGFIKFFNARITGKGLYLIDEPEAALSPSRQLQLMSLMKAKVEQTGSQFIVATHSPIMMAMPGCSIYQFHDGKISAVSLEETDHYRITRGILENPDEFLGEL